MHVRVRPPRCDEGPPVLRAVRGPRGERRQEGPRVGLRRGGRAVRQEEEVRRGRGLLPGDEGGARKVRQGDAKESGQVQKER